MIRVASGVVEATLDTMRLCGAGQRECLLYWKGATNDEDVVGVVHPLHDSTWGSCEVDGAWATRYFLDLADRRERTVAQVHSHPGSLVQHSRTDDSHVLVPTAGFISIVVPRFGIDDDRAGWGIWRLERDGMWAAAPEAIAWLIA
jgi:hypothetical protein